MTRLGFAIAAATAALSMPVRHQQARMAADSTQPSIEAEIRAVQAQMRQAAERLDVAALYAHVLDTETPPIIENGRLADTRSSALDRTAQGFQGLTGLSYAYTRENVTVITPTTVLWIGTGTASATLQDGRQVAGPFAESVLFLKRDGKWKVVHAHRSTPNR